MKQVSNIKNQDKDTFITYKVPRFTLIGATTLAGLLNRPLRERFGIEVEAENISNIWNSFKSELDTFIDTLKRQRQNSIYPF